MKKSFYTNLCILFWVPCVFLISHAGNSHGDEYYNSPLDLVGASYWHNHGITGSGINIAVIDQDFDDDNLQNLDYVIELKKYGFASDTDLTSHGDQCIKIIHQVSPGARLYLFETKVSMSSDVLNEILNDILKTLNDDDTENDIQIISMSMALFPKEFLPYTNPPNDLSETARLIRELREQGVLFVMGSGNYAVQHYITEDFEDKDGDKIYDINLKVKLLNGEDGRLYLYPKNGKVKDYNVRIDGSSWVDAQGATIVYNENNSGLSYINVKYVGQDKPSGFEIFFPNIDQIEYPEFSQDGSLGFPAGVKEVISVGAVWFENVVSKDSMYVERFSSRGVNYKNDESLLKPDFVAPDRYSYDQNYSNWIGTSFSAPLVAGGLALLLEAYLEEIPQKYFQSEHAVSLLSCNAIDYYPPGKDNVTGYGLIQLQDDDCEFLIDGTRCRDLPNAYPLQKDSEYELRAFDEDYFKVKISGLASIKITYEKDINDSEDYGLGLGIYRRAYPGYSPIDLNVQTKANTSDSTDSIKVVKEIHFKSPREEEYYIVVSPIPFYHTYKYTLFVHQGTVVNFTSPASGNTLVQGNVMHIEANCTGYSGQNFDLGLYKDHVLVASISSNLQVQDGNIDILWKIPSSLDDSSEYRLGLTDINSNQRFYSDYFTIAHSSPSMLNIKFRGDGRGVIYINSDRQCEHDCTISFDEPTQITLQVDPEANFHFQKWVGIENCKNENPCSFWLDQHMDVYAYFQENVHPCYDFNATKDDVENTPFVDIWRGPYCANSWISHDIDGDGYSESYLLTGSTYLAWTSAQAWKWDSGSAVIYDIYTYGNKQECYDGACDGYFERYLFKQTFNSPSNEIKYPDIRWYARLSDTYYWIEWGSFVLQSCWDENGNGEYCDEGDHIENYLVINCGVDEDCGPGKQCIKPYLSEPTGFYCAPKDYYLTQIMHFSVT